MQPDSYYLPLPPIRDPSPSQRDVQKRSHAQSEYGYSRDTPPVTAKLEAVHPSQPLTDRGLLLLEAGAAYKELLSRRSRTAAIILDREQVAT